MLKDFFIKVIKIQSLITTLRLMLSYLTSSSDQRRSPSVSLQGAFTFGGHMIDKPLLLQARNVLRMQTRSEGS